MKARWIHRLRRIGTAEGLSFLALLLIGMPLKHALGIPLGVKVLGWLHGLLFMTYLWVLVQATVEARWSLGKAAKLLLSALVPFGPFLVDAGLKEEQMQAEGSSNASEH